MPDWLRRSPREEPTVEVGGTVLPVAIRRLRTARRMTLRLAPDGREARLSIPHWARTAEALAFARSRADWLAAQLANLPAPRQLGPGGALPYRGELLNIEHSPKARRTPERLEGAVLLGGPEESVALRLQRWLQAEARVLLADDLAHYCDKAALPVPPLSLSGAQRRWGSCSARGEIRINWRLIMAPDLVRRSVVAHEVTHLLHFDHSPRFKATLDGLFEGEVAEADRWLKREGRSLYTWFAA